MSEEMRFFIYLLENYANEKGIRGDIVYQTWKNAGIVDYIYDMYFQYHQERLENAYEDIDEKLLMAS